MYSATLVVLDYTINDVLFIRLTDDMVKSIEEEYENDSEAWLAESGLDEMFCFSIENSNCMFVNDVPDIFYCYPKNGKKVQIHPVM